MANNQGDKWDVQGSFTTPTKDVVALEGIHRYMAFVLDLPFWLRLPEGWETPMLQFNGKKAAIRFCLKEGAQKLADVEETFHYSQAVVFIELRQEEVARAIDRPAEFLPNALGLLNDFIDGYRVMSGFYDVNNVGRIDLPYVYQCYIQPCEKLIPVFNIKGRDTRRTKYLENNVLQKVSACAVHLSERKTYPYNTSLRLFARAWTYYWQEELRIAVMEAQSMFEAFVDACILDLMQRCGMASRDKIEEILENTPFKNKLTDHISRLLNADCDVNGSGRIGIWYRDAYMLRNKVTHEGYWPSREEVKRAMQAYGQAYEYLNNLQGALQCRSGKI